ncbi:hypothetical protein DI09_2p10, partial [Mitosporidium daphniae]
ASIDSSGSIKLWDVSTENLESAVRTVSLLDIDFPSPIYAGLTPEYRKLLVSPTERLFISWRLPDGNFLAIPSNDSIQIYSLIDNKFTYCNSLFGGHTKIDESGSFMYIPIVLNPLSKASENKNGQLASIESAVPDVPIARHKRKNTISEEVDENNGMDADKEAKALPSTTYTNPKTKKTSQPIESSDEEMAALDEFADDHEFDDDMEEAGEEEEVEDGLTDHEEEEDYKDNLENIVELQGRRLAKPFKSVSTFSLPSIPVLQPGSTPIIEKRRFLAWNSIGWITVLYDEDSDDLGTIDIGFNDHSAMKPVHFVDYVGYHFGALSKKGAFFASKYKSRNPFKNEVQAKPSSLYYLPFLSWAPKSEWRAELSESESVLAIACTDDYSVVATDLLYIHIYSLGGIQLFLFSIPEPIVSLVAEGNILFSIFGRFSDITTQRLSFSIFDLKEQRDIPISNRLLPLSSPDSSSNAIKFRSLVSSGDPVSVVWTGFVDNLCIPSFMDSCGIVRALFSESGWQWVPILDCYKQVMGNSNPDTATGVKMNLFPVSLDENNMLVAMMKGDDPWPAVFPKPVIKELAIYPPSPLGRIDFEIEKKYTYGIINNAYGNVDGVLPSKRRAENSKLDKLLFELLKLSLALEICSLFHLEKSFDFAIQLTSASHLVDLSRRIKEVKLKRFSTDSCVENETDRNTDIHTSVSQLLIQRDQGSATFQSKNSSSFMNSILEDPRTHENHTKTSIKDFSDTFR